MSNIQIPTAIQLAHFDMAGTTIDDEIGDICIEDCQHYGKELPIMMDGFEKGLKAVGYSSSSLGKTKFTTMFNIIQKHRGGDKLEGLYKIIMEIKTGREIEDDIDWHSPDIDPDAKQQADSAHDVFIDRAVELSERVDANEGVPDLYKRLNDAGVYVVAATGFATQITDALMNKLGWLDKSNEEYIDLVVNKSKAGAGRPQPNMINFALNESKLLYVPMKKMGIVDPNFDYSVVMKVGDTSKDVDEGIRIGALTIATLEGTQPLEKITSKGQPHYIVDHTRDIIGLIDGGKIVMKPYQS